MKMKFVSFAILLVLLPLGPVMAADQPSPTELRMRDALRNTMLQLRDAQNQNATLQGQVAALQTQITTLEAAQKESDKEKAALKKQIDTMTKQAATEKDAHEKAVAALNASLTERDTAITQLKAVIEKWKVSHKQAVDVANQKEAERAKLEIKAADLEKLVEDRETKNAELFKTGNEILTRYEKFSLGDAIGAKEPFTGTMRVKLQTLVQDYQDKLADQKVTPGTTATAPHAN